MQSISYQKNLNIGYMSLCLDDNSLISDFELVKLGNQSVYSLIMENGLNNSGIVF